MSIYLFIITITNKMVIKISLYILFRLNCYILNFINYLIHHQKIFYIIKHIL